MWKRGWRFARARVEQLGAGVLRWVWPHRCIGCDGEVDPCKVDIVDAFCEICRGTLIEGTESCCPICGLVWLDEPHPDGIAACGPCLVSRPRFARARGAFAYGGALKVAIQRWKNGQADALGPALSTLLVNRLDAMGSEGWPDEMVVVPIPSPRRRIWRRGFNPAGVLARGVSRRTKFPLRLALKLRRSAPQTRGMNRDQRRRRMRGMFVAKGSSVTAKAVLLVDDVMTTGATVDAAAACLKRAGAARVDVVTLARVAW